MEVDTTRKSVAASAVSPSNLVGSYVVGFCFFNTSGTAITDNDWVNGWVMVVD